MSGFKRKKIVLLSSSSEEEEEEKVAQTTKGKAKPKKREAAAASATKKRKPLVISDDDDDSDEGDNAVSINDIKKQAKSKARKLMNADDDDDIGGSGGGGKRKGARTSTANNKTPPSQKNTLFNYFKPSSGEEKKKAASGAEDAGSGGTSSSAPFTSVKEKGSAEKKEKEKATIGDDFMTTKLTKGKPAVVVRASSSDQQASSSSSSKPKAESKVKEEEAKKTSAASSSKSTTTTKETTTTKKDSSKAKEKEKESQFSKVKAKKEEEEAAPKKQQLPSPPLKQSPLKAEVDEKKPSLAKGKLITPVKKEPAAKAAEPAPKPAKALAPSTSSAPAPAPALPRLVEPKRVSDLWVDKYRPRSSKAIIGLQGDRSPLAKLAKWLRNWHLNLDKKPNYGGRWGGGSVGADDGAGFRAALLSGPPGIGKTTTAVLVCAEAGYDALELNASDVRSRRSLAEDVGELLANTKLTSFFSRPSGGGSSTLTSNSSKPSLTSKHCVIMDEVDGMSGNEDRGGVAELIQLIKKSKVPLICICNDRGDAKMRTLVNYCYDLRFSRPNVAQIKAALRSIAFKEKLSVTDGLLEELIASSNNDIRQCIHGLSMLAAGRQEGGGTSARVSEMINAGKGYSRPIKDVKLGPFEAIKKVFATGEEYARMSFEDKSGLFFADYGIMPLFVYENYPTINVASKEVSVAKQLRRLSAAINAISLGDLVEREVRSNMTWSLLPLQAAFSTVMPGAAMRSANGLAHMPAFPAWMGKLSTTNKNHRLADELVAHMRLAITGTRTAFPLDYLQPLAVRLVAPLAGAGAAGDGKTGISSVLDLMAAYALTKANMDSLLELSLWSGMDDPLKKVDSKVKAALTRAYNSSGGPLPYATEGDFKKVTKRGAKKEEAKGGKGGKKPKKNSLVVMDERAAAEEEIEEEEEEEVPEDMDFF